MPHFRITKYSVIAFSFWLIDSYRRLFAYNYGIWGSGNRALLILMSAVDSKSGQFHTSWKSSSVLSDHVHSLQGLQHEHLPKYYKIIE
jgi:hypothetical protein